MPRWTRREGSGDQPAERAPSLLVNAELFGKLFRTRAIFQQSSFPVVATKSIDPVSKLGHGQGTWWTISGARRGRILDQTSAVDTRYRPLGSGRSPSSEPIPGRRWIVSPGSLTGDRLAVATAT